MFGTSDFFIGYLKYVERSLNKYFLHITRILENSKSNIYDRSMKRNHP